jgi:3-hydroxybutyryl-CoA dehydratase
MTKITGKPPATQDSRPYTQDSPSSRLERFELGDSDSFTKTITEADIVLFAGITGDTNPLHIDAEYARTTQFGKRVAHGMLTASLISTVIGTRLPGTGAIYAGQTLRFVAPVFIGDTITATATLEGYDRERGKLTLATVCFNQDGKEVVTGEAVVFYRPNRERPEEMVEIPTGR